MSAIELSPLECNVGAILCAIGDIVHAPVRARASFVVRVLHHLGQLVPFRPMARLDMEDGDLHVARMGQVACAMIAQVFVVGVDHGIQLLEIVAVGDLARSTSAPRAGFLSMILLSFSQSAKEAYG